MSRRHRHLRTTQAPKSEWASDVLRVVRSLNKADFWLSDMYSHAEELAKLHPNNAHVREKIRQQLQLLRDRDLIEFLGAGHYRLR